MVSRNEYRSMLRDVEFARWAEYLRAHSGLPGPRANIELAEAAADEGTPAVFDELIATDQEYLVFCGVLGLGRELAAAGGPERRLHRHAGDARWRVREAVAMALQRLGDADLPRLLDLVGRWAADDDPLVQRAALAGICEPRLLRTPEAAAAAVHTCEEVTRSLAARPRDARHDPRVRTLRQALGYCWSVAVAADPVAGLPRFLALTAYGDHDVAWVVRQNRKQPRLARLLSSRQGSSTA